MTTRLTLHVPSDLSVGRVSLDSGGSTVHDWIASPGNSSLETAIEPGVYVARIEPLGQPTRSYLFDVKPNEANTVTIPPLSVLASGPQPLSSELSKAVFESYRAKAIDVTPTIDLGVRSSALMGLEAQTGDDTDVAGTKTKIMTLGISQDTTPTRPGGWVPYKSPYPVGQYVADGGLDIVVERKSLALPPLDAGARMRLSLAIEKVRVERCMIPLYLGGVRIQVRPVFKALDLDVFVHPVDKERRAMTQALRAGSSSEARVVFSTVLTDGVFERFISSDGDPWAATVAALLAIRFPDLAKPGSVEWASTLAKEFPWIPDAHILEARRALLAAGKSADAIERGTVDALRSLARARRVGAPYFAYANQLARELLSGLNDKWRTPHVLANEVNTEWRRWLAHISLQREAGASFSWVVAQARSRQPSESSRRLEVEQSPVQPQGDEVSAPYVATRGLLDRRFSKVIFSGYLRDGSIVLGANRASSGPNGDEAEFQDTFVAQTGRMKTAKVANAPALRRPIVYPKDPNKGRFGGKDHWHGFRLGARFSEKPSSKKKWIDITLFITCTKKTDPAFTDTVIFYLHDTFSPSRIEGAFRGSRAEIRISAWGGFTVGAWLPEHHVELELDLAKMDEAPFVIRTY